jgi:hypothetical protein
MRVSARKDGMKCRHSERSEESPREAQTRQEPPRDCRSHRGRVAPGPVPGESHRRQASHIDMIVDAAAFAAERFARGLLGKLGVTVGWSRVGLRDSTTSDLRTCWVLCPPIGVTVGGSQA